MPIGKLSKSEEIYWDDILSKFENYRDLRKSIEGLVMLVETELKLDRLENRHKNCIL